MWASTDTANKVTAGADGKYTLEVARHSGTFTITANYKKLIPGSSVDLYYKASNPKTVKITSPTHSLNIPLKYGYTTTFTLTGTLYDAAGNGTRSEGVTMRIEVEGRKAASGQTSGSTGPKYSAKVAHPGIVNLVASHSGYKTKRVDGATITGSTFGYNISLVP